MKQRIIALHGAYRGNNFGDVLLLSLFAGWIRETIPDASVLLPFASPVVRGLVTAEGSSSPHSVFRANALIYGGGGYFGEPTVNPKAWGYRLIKNHIPVGAATRIRRRPYGIIGVGAGPLSNVIARECVVWLCNGARIVAVRDEESREYLIEYGVDGRKIAVTADAALTIKQDSVPEAERERAREVLAPLKGRYLVGVHLSEPPELEDKTRLLKKEIVSFAGQNPDVGFVLISDSEGSRDQLSAASELAGYLSDRAVIVKYEKPWQLVAVLSRLDMVVTTKLHVGIVASALEKVVLSFPKHMKTPRFYKQIGGSDRCVPLTVLQSGRFSELAQPYVDSPCNIPLPTEVQQSAARNRKLVSEFLTGIAG